MPGDWPRRAALASIALFQRVAAPLLPPACRYLPSCSEYAADAILRHGLCKGSALAVLRVLRCNPMARGGIDPVR